MSIPSRSRAVIYELSSKTLKISDLPAAWPKSGEAIIQVEVTTLSPPDLEGVAGDGLSSKASPQDQFAR